MQVTSLGLSNFRAFDQLADTALGKINVIVGPNNAGKSSIIRALNLLQAGGHHWPDVRLGAKEASVRIGLAGIGQEQREQWGQAVPHTPAILTITLSANADRTGGGLACRLAPLGGGNYGVNPIPARAPNHFVVPYLSKRKVTGYNEDVREQFALEIPQNFANLAAKLSLIGNGTFPGHEAYAKACGEILGFVVTAVPSAAGNRPGVYLADRRTLPMDQMGEGVPNIVGMLTELVLASGKLFLIEEPENDLHPEALKALLDLVVKSSETNQFVVSTHSNIVAKHLCSVTGSRLFHVTSNRDAVPPVAALKEVDPKPTSRLAVLRELGYALSDFELWDGWIIVEEASAERIIRDYLIPWFAPKLMRTRTVSAGGADKVDVSFEDFRRLVLFTHLEPVYKNSSWVRIDGDEKGRGIVEAMRIKYPDWPADRFDTFSEGQFERYYPQQFRDRVNEVLAMDGDRKREAKRTLLNEVREWLDADFERGRVALGESAVEVISALQEIEAQLQG